MDAVRNGGVAGMSLPRGQKKCHRSSFSPFWIHRTSPMRKQTVLISFLESEKTADAGKHSKTRAEKEVQIILLLSSQFWPMPSMSRGVINCAKLFLSHPLSRIKWFDQWAVDRDPVLTSTTSAKIGKSAVKQSNDAVGRIDTRGKDVELQHLVDLI